MTKTTEFPIEFREESNYSSEPGSRAFYSINTYPWRIFITFENNKLESVLVDTGTSSVNLERDGEMVIGIDEPHYREVVTTAVDAIEAHWAKNALRTIWKAVR